MKRFPLLMTVLLASATTNALANGIATYIEPQPSSPVKLLGCDASFKNVSNGWGTNYYDLTLGSRFQNNASRAAVAVMVRFELANAFGDAIGTRFGQSSGNFSEGVAIDGQQWTDIDTWPGLAIVRCSISRVLFDDGTTWKDGIASPTATP